MPELSRFYGIIIRMFYGDHAPHIFTPFIKASKSR